MGEMALTEAAAAPRQRRRLLARIGPRNRKLFPWLLVAPTILVLAGIGIYPFIYALYIAGHNIVLSKPYLPRIFVGLYQYQSLIQDPAFWQSVKLTVIFTVEAVFIEFWLGLGLALLFRRQLVGASILRLLILLPMIIPPLVVGFIWRYMFFPGVGLVTYYVGGIANALFGVESLPFLADPDWALQTIIFVDVWEWTPFMFLILSAGLASIPKQPYEAAEIDGASSWRVFWTITLPLLKPAILIAVVIRTMDAFRVFELIRVMTQGGPGNATTTLNIMLTKTGLEFFDASRAAALSLLMMMAIIVFSFIFIRVFRSNTSLAS
ncbi:MAG TPA: sugar ABC transporter permease [Bauldia sp.]|nr:sugar ABC transporter permease [Bauldia sp.]